MHEQSFKYNELLIEKINKLIDSNIVVYEKIGIDTKFSVDLLIEMFQFQNNINNCGDYNSPKLLIFDKFFDVGTEFRKKDNLIMTKNKSNFGYEFDLEGNILKTINWIDLD